MVCGRDEAARGMLEKGHVPKIKKALPLNQTGLKLQQGGVV
jgi:hypothetical protein